MILDYCDKCDSLMYENHRCYEYKITIHKDDFYADGESVVQYGFSAEDAAEKFAVKWNEDEDYRLIDDTVIIVVTNLNGESKKLKIGAEKSIKYFVSDE